jgi:serine phosphatase RsbU (regulator of sigma subunit)
MLMTSSIGHALDLASPWEPGMVLSEVNHRVKAELGQTYRPGVLEGAVSSEEVMGADEGMDVTCLWVDHLTGEVTFAGAKHSLWLFHPDATEPEEIKGDRIGVGYVSTPDDQVWTSRTLPIEAGAVLLGSSDGIMDQIGGPKKIAFGKRHLWQAFRPKAPGDSLKHRLEAAYSAMQVYQGLEPRRDDVSLVAIRL